MFNSLPSLTLLACLNWTILDRTDYACAILMTGLLAGLSFLLADLEFVGSTDIPSQLRV